MTALQQKGLSPDRVCNPNDVNFVDLECPICHDILWKPVACQVCETPFCSPCIHQWLKGETKCPNGCKTYIERKCPPFIAKLLARLQVSCFYQSKGCSQTCSYEALEKHESECNYQVMQCPGCETNLMRKDLTAHKRNCGAIKVSCKDCKMIYKRGEFNKKHTQNACLREQVRQLREEAEESKYRIQMLTSQVNDLIIWKSRISQEKTISFDDLPPAMEETRWLPSIFKGLKWTKMVYMARPYALTSYPTSGYMAAFIASSNRHIAFFNEEASISSEKADEKFNLVSISVCAAWNDKLKLTLTAYRNSDEVSTHTSMLHFGKPQNISLQWQNIDKLILQPIGESGLVENQEAASDTHCIITQIILNESS
ncbi:hypothetical protein I4U23_014046 [Adineta vaga]|nr:hypothetical protein I4U23_014046 [Adineta vaga]